MSRLPHCLLLDMNDTFMFNADRFGENEDFSIVYRQLGGQRLAGQVNRIIRSAYDYLDVRYPDAAFRYCFPSVESALIATSPDLDSDSELQILVSTFATHELGVIPDAYANAINQLSKLYTLGLVIDIWSPPPLWQVAFRAANISESISAISFSSDIQTVKPAPEPFTDVLSKLNADKNRSCLKETGDRSQYHARSKAGWLIQPVEPLYCLIVSVAISS